jgi:hypothetical protein
MKQLVNKGALFFLVIILLSGCATYYKEKVVFVKSKDDKASVSVRNFVTSENVGVYVKKHRPFVATTTRPGYKTKSTIIKPKVPDPAVLLSTIPLVLNLSANGGEVSGLTFAFGALAGGDLLLSGAMHSGKYVVDEIEKLPSSNHDDIFVKLNPDMDTLVIENLSIYIHQNANDWEKRSKKKPFKSDKQTYEAPIDVLEGVLEDLNYSNIQNDIIQNYDKNFSIDMKVLDASEHRLKTLGTSMELLVRYTFCDIFGNALNFIDVKCESALFSNGYKASSFPSNKAFVDALTNGLSYALKSDEFESLYNRAREAFENTHEKGGVTLLKAPKENFPDFNNMADAQITIEGDGYHGSGCLISPDGLAITSHRVVGTKSEVEIIFSNGAKKKAKIIRKDPISNLVLLSSDTTGVSSLKLSKSTSGRVGEGVFCVGSPVNKVLSQSISSGIVSGYRDQNGVRFLQTDAKISNGNNGSPIVDRNGYVVGIVNEKYLGIAFEGISFAVCAEDIIEGLNLNTEY